MDRTTQIKRTLEALEAHREAGLPADWFWENGIRRGAARIHDLKQVGYIIDGRQVGSQYRYFLCDNEQMPLGGPELFPGTREALSKLTVRPEASHE